VECQVSDLVGLLDALDCDSVDIVGASMGGVTAYNFAAKHPQRVGRLALVDVSPEVFSPRHDNQPRITPVSEDRFASIEDAITTRSSVYRRPDDPRVREAIERNIMLLADGSTSWRYDLHWLAKSWLASGDADEQWQLLSQVAAPTLVLRGTESPMFPPELAERVCNTVPTASLAEIPEAGHPIAMDQPALLLRTLLTFLWSP
jgi:pimeloyl-ACP methyl ester carboxylesterase